MNRTKSKPNCISLFTGAGGLDLGLEVAGFETLYASDIDEHSCITLRNGSAESLVRKKPFFRHSAIHNTDIRAVSGRDILTESGLQKGQVDLVAGGPPCQAFSVFGRRKGRDDPRGQLVDHYLRVLADLEPKSFLFENVFGLLTIGGGAVFAELKEKLANPARGLHYNLSVHRLNAVNYGVPQFRDRIFVIGDRDGLAVDQIPEVSGDQQELLKKGVPARTVRDALRGLPPIGDNSISNHVGRKHSQRIIDRYASLKPGERDHCTRINRLDLDRPSFTIIVGSDAGGGKGHVHPTDPREVTPRESARIQTFPDWWSFSGTSRHPIRQVGNAVPPILGAAVGSALMKNLFNRRRKSFDSILALLDQDHLLDDKRVAA